MKTMLTAKIHIQPFHHVTDVLSHAMGFSRAFADALSIYATGVSQAHITILETMRPSSDDLRLQELQSGRRVQGRSSISEAQAERGVREWMERKHP
jgi:hypothetical protein